MAEIQSRTDPTDWYWVSTEHNPADLTTRECTVAELGPDSVRQTGPKFLYLQHQKWPVKRCFEKELPDTVYVEAAASACEAKEVKPKIDIERFSSYRELLLVTRLLLVIGYCK